MYDTRAWSTTSNGITIVAVLAGSRFFLGDLIRQLPIIIRTGMVKGSSYAGRTTTSKGSTLTWSQLSQVCDREVLMVYYISETGAALKLVQAEVKQTGARMHETAVLMRKPSNTPVDFGAFGPQFCTSGVTL